MRIIRGKYGGRVISINKKFSSRPTTDIAKESLFNILDNRYYYEEKTALDLFAGTGSIGYEFLSRGCSHVTFIEKSVPHIKIISDIANTLEIEDINIIKSDVFKYVKDSFESYYFIFADPPFDLERFEEIPDAIFSNNILLDEGLFILEHSPEHNFEKHPNFVEHRKYGKVNFSFFEHK